MPLHSDARDLVPPRDTNHFLMPTISMPIASLECLGAASARPSLIEARFRGSEPLHTVNRWAHAP
jgi:hypothetical protein